MRGHVFAKKRTPPPLVSLERPSPRVRGTYPGFLRRGFGMTGFHHSSAGRSPDNDDDRPQRKAHTRTRSPACRGILAYPPSPPGDP